MEHIQVTFPNTIPVQKVKTIIEEGMRQDNSFPCEVEFLKEDNEENEFLIKSDCAEAFYCIGMIASIIIGNHKV